MTYHSGVDVLSQGDRHGQEAHSFARCQFPRGTSRDGTENDALSQSSFYKAVTLQLDQFCCFETKNCSLTWSYTEHLETGDKRSTVFARLCDPRFIHSPSFRHWLALSHLCVRFHNAKVRASLADIFKACMWHHEAGSAGLILLPYQCPVLLCILQPTLPFQL